MTPAPDQETVERVARAIWAADGLDRSDDNGWHGRSVSEATREAVRAEARAAIAAMPVPEAADRLAALAVLSPDELRGWRPIETAPRDGTRLLLWMEPMNDARFRPTDGPHTVIATWVVWSDAMKREGMREGWSWYGSPLHYPTHWRPLPDPPSSIIAEQP